MVLDSLIMEKDVNRLKRLPSISHAFYQVHKESDASCVVVYTIDENFTLIPFANLFSSSNDDFAFRIGLQEFNLMGRNMTLSGFYQYDIFNSFGLSFRAPYLFSNKLGLAFSYNNFTTQEPVFLDNGEADYRYNNEGNNYLNAYRPAAKPSPHKSQPNWSAEDCRH